MTLHVLAKTYGGRPSAWVGVSDEIGALTLDMAAVKAGLEEEERASKRAAQRARRR